MDVEKLGSYIIEGTLGVGAMGVVYKARHDKTNKVAAVKVISADIAQRGKAYERFKREAEILQQFRHPNIVRILAVGKFKGTSYFAMEYIQGRTLEQLLKERGPLDWKEVVGLGRQMCEALHYAHEHGVVHRDLKPSNLMVTDDGQVKLTDFGIAKDLDATALTATGRTLGTAAYMATEQIRGTPEVSHKTDLYALGVVLYQMLTGLLPFEGSSHMIMMHAHINSPIPRPSAKLAEIPKALDELVVKLMAKDPSERPWDAAAVGQAFAEMEEKAKKREKVAMVWPSGDVDPQVDTRGMTNASANGLAAPAKKKRKKRAAEPDDSTPEERRRKLLGSLGLVAALLVVGSGIYYVLKPPSQEWLFEKAKGLMATKERTDWKEARDRYIEPLDRRFPDNPYKEITREWRDKLLLTEAQARADRLSSDVRVQLNQPNTENEERFVHYHTQVVAVQDLGNDRRAAEVWDAFALEMKPDESEDDRKWWLYANHAAEGLRKGIESRGKQVMALRDEANRLEALGNLVEARNLRNQVRAKFGKFTDVIEIIGPAPVAPTPPQSAPIE